jgi:hypothetical protein
VRAKKIVKLVKDDTWPHADGPALKVQAGYLPNVTGAVNDQAITNSAADQASAGTARDD